MDKLVSNRKRPPAAPHPTREQAEDAVRTLIAFAGDDPARPALGETPRRVATVFEEFFSGYGEDPRAVLESALDDTGDYGDMVVVRDIPFVSHCEHHLLPIIGKAHVGYRPDRCLAGLSKLARVVDIFARRLQTQERLTTDIASAIEAALRPKGTAVMIEAEHQCMTLRGIAKPGTTTVTTAFAGTFGEDAEERARFLALIGS